MRYLVGCSLLLLTFASLVGCRAGGTKIVGDGVLTEGGFWSYPRYQVVFASLDVPRKPEAAFRCKGIPTARMTFGLIVTADPEAGSKAGAAGLDQTWDQTMIDVKIEDGGGAPLASVHAALRDWALSRSLSRTMLWHPSLRDLAFDRRSLYKIRVNLSRLDPAAGRLRLKPVLEGGGNELP